MTLVSTPPSMRIYPIGIVSIPDRRTFCAAAICFAIVNISVTESTNASDVSFTNVITSFVTDGIIKRDSKARLIRDGVIIYDGKMGSLQREKDSVKEVKKGLECGITITNFSDIKVGDVIEAYEMVEKK